MKKILWIALMVSFQASVSAEELKIGYVKLSAVFDQYERTQESDGTLEKKGRAKEDEYQSRVKELQRLKDRLEMLNEDARAQAVKDIEDKAEDLERFRNRTARDLKRERDSIAKGILDEIQAHIDRYALANGFSLILDDRYIVFGQQTHDVTQDVLQELNTTYQASH